jgi:hypothetical protein
MGTFNRVRFSRRPCTWLALAVKGEKTGALRCIKKIVFTPEERIQQTFCGT